MRRFAKPTGLARALSHHHHQQPRCQQRRYITQERRTLSQYPSGSLLDQGHAPTKERFPTFELSDVVLDLDAEDNPYVRPFDTDKDGPLQDSKWGYDPVVDDVKSEARAMKLALSSDLQQLRAATRLPFHGRRLSDHDIMAVALIAGSFPLELEPGKGRPHDAGDPRVLKLQSELIRDGIPKAVRSHPNKIIPFLLHRQQLTLAALENPSQDGPSGADHEESFREGIAKCKDLVQLRKLCSRIDRPGSGVEISTASIDHVHSRLLQLLQSGDGGATPAEILRFVNNVTIKRMSANKELNRSMTLFGLQLASHLGLLSCILQYLHICLSLGFVTKRAESVALTRSQVGDALLAALQRGDGAARGYRQQIFTLLTGRGPDGLAPQACLFGLATDDLEQNPAMVPLYVTLLGELGAVRLLAHQWRQRSQQLGAPSALAKQSPGSDEADNVFVKAFLRCAQLLCDVNMDDGTRVNLTTATGNIEQDAALDWHTINGIDSIHAGRGSGVPRPSLTGVKEGVSASEIIDAFNTPDTREAVGHLKNLVDRVTANVVQ